MNNKLTAVQQAQRMFEKLVNAKINKAPLPTPQVRTFPVATIPGGMVVLSNGQTRQAFAQKRADQIARTNANQMKIPNDTTQDLNQINKEITTPKKDLDLGGQGGVDFFINLLSQYVKPKLEGSPEIGPLTALLPSLQDKLIPTAKTSAMANLPELPGPETKNLFSDNAGFYKRFLNNTGSIQQELAKDFLSQYTNREQPVVSQAMGRGPISLISDYKSRFGIPSARNAGYAQVANDVNIFNKRIQ